MGRRRAELGNHLYLLIPGQGRLQVIDLSMLLCRALGH